MGSLSVEARMPTLRVIRLTGLPRSAHRDWRPAPVGVDEPACVLFTSGSTGRPKGIVNSQRNLLQRVAQSINAAHINTADRLLTLASPSTIVGVRDVLTALLAGASIHLLDPQAHRRARDPERDPCGSQHHPVRLSGSLAIDSRGSGRTRRRRSEAGACGRRHNGVERHRDAARLAGTRGRDPTRLRRDRSADDAVVRGRHVQA